MGVTQFFRDPDAFDALRNSVLPKLMQGKPDGDPIRIWVPACSTAEEVYSVGILLGEAMEQQSIDRKVQIFGTDIDDFAVTFARAGHYNRRSFLGSS
jgi:two-component system CheB/CheR fusion protein